MATKKEEAKEQHTIYAALRNVQKKLKAPKGQENKFGGYKYRSAEDIMEAAKPILYEEGLSLNVTDKVDMVGDRIYITAKATIFNDEGESISSTASAREELSKKGMDASQVTGAASSYARKYAMNGLFAIDDTRDADYLNSNKEYTDPKAQEAAYCKPILDDLNTVVDRASFETMMKKWKPELSRPLVSAKCQELAKKYPKV